MIEWTNQTGQRLISFITMKIACPNCSTKYSLKEQALGTSGRKMKCAKCAQVWHALPSDVILPIAPNAEQKLPELTEPVGLPISNEDEVQWEQDLADELEAEAQKLAQQQAGQDQPVSHYETKDEAKERRSFRVILKNVSNGSKSAIQALCNALIWLKHLNPKEQIAIATGLLMPLALVGVVYVARDNLVSKFPDLASLYESVGINVNLQGLAFEDIRTIRRPENGVAVLVVEGVIRNITDEAKNIPKLHFILSGRDREVYSWQDNSIDGQLSAGDRIEFRTVLASPPDVADQLHVRFFSSDQRMNRL